MLLLRATGCSASLARDGGAISAASVDKHAEEVVRWRTECSSAHAGFCLRATQASLGMCKLAAERQL